MKKQKSLTNKGFSLVELIIVVAIMAVLIGVLAPQYLRYVERTRLQRDNTSMGELANVIKMASAEEDVVKEIGALTDKKVSIKFNATGACTADTDLATSAPKLLAEIKATMDLSEVKLTSNTYLAASAQPTITVEIDPDTNQFKVSTDKKWKDKPTDEEGVEKVF